MVFNEKKPWILFGAGYEGRKLVFGLTDTEQEVYAFVDNDAKKVGTTICGKKVISFEELVEIHDGYQVVITVSKDYQKEIVEQLRWAGILDIIFLNEAHDIVDYRSRQGLRKYKNMYQGKRVFVIGTGPSLTVEDLEKLDDNGEISFASNKIFKIFTRTKWRPQIYCATDFYVLQQYRDVILDMPIENMLLSNFGAEEINEVDEEKGIDWFRLIYKPIEENELPMFSDSPDKYVIDAYTVTYVIMQWAAYMGFKEVYLLGVDFDYGDGKCGYKHFIEGYDEKTEKIIEPQLEQCLKAYKMAEKYSRENGFRIYNATRGGRLEVFERVNFDDLFEVEI